MKRPFPRLINKPRRPGGILRRWLINSFTAVLLIVLVSVVAFVVATSGSYYSIARITLEQRALTDSSFFDRNYNRSYNTYYAGALGLVSGFTEGDRMELQFISSARRIVMSTGGYGAGLLVNTPDVLAAIEQSRPEVWTGEDPLSGDRVMAVSAPLISQSKRVVGVMRYVTSLSLIDRQIFWLTGIALLVGVGFIIIITFTSLVFIRGITKPIHEINEAAKRIAEGRYGTRIEKRYNDEIGELADNINHMSSEINTAEKMKSDFISSISHELRTPLTAINGWGETLISADINDPKEIKKGVSVMLKETVRLIKLVEELLDFTRMEGNRLHLNLEQLDLKSELEDIVFMYTDALRRDGIDLNFTVPDYIPPIMGDRARLKQVFFNILDNAQKHGVDGKRIDITLSRQGGTVSVTVRDHGQGIPPEELPHVKYKFYKGTSKARGNGLGLSISDEIIRLHDGELIIESVVGEGTAVTVSLPAYVISF